MGITAAIARVKQGVKKGGLPAVVAGLGEQLRSDAIPAPLRPAATRLADLLRVPAPREAIAISDEQAQQPSLDMMEGAGVCPFTGLRADESAQTVSAVYTAPAQAVSETPEPLPEAGADAAPDAAEGGLTAAEAAAAEARDEADAVGAVPVTGDDVSVAEPTPAPAAASAKKKPAARARPSTPPASSAETDEKHEEGVAAKPASAKTSARSSNRPAAKRPSAKANKKK